LTYIEKSGSTYIEKSGSAYIEKSRSNIEKSRSSELKLTKNDVDKKSYCVNILTLPSGARSVGSR